MKKLIYLLSLTVFVLSFTGCKKGENDPFLSLKSRKARLAGEWKVSSREQTYSYTSTGVWGTSNSYTSTYNGSIEVENGINNGISYSTEDQYTTDFVFEKDGTYTTTVTFPDGSAVIKGNWAFLGKSKKAELKNKEAIALTTTSETYYGETTTTSGTFFPFNVLIIDQLKSKEIVFTFDETSTSTNSTSTSKGKMTLTAK